ncbi:MAG: hypothetical protein ABEK50_11325 [bacterium]
MVELQRILLEQRRKKPGLLQQFFRSHPLTEKRIRYSKDQARRIRRRIEIPRKKQLNRFDEAVVNPWKSRKPAYGQFDKGMGLLKS